MIGICTDSNAQLPAELVDRYGIVVVPLTVRIDGEDHLEGVDLDADDFYARFAGGATPEVSTAAPPPGRIAAAYATLADRGATEILSVHIGSTVSATLNAARVAATLSRVPVRLVDTRTASFAIGCCVWEAAEAIAAGATAEEAALLAESVASRCGNVFVVRALDLARSGGRLDQSAAPAAGIPVLSMVAGTMSVVAHVHTLEEAATTMAVAVRSWGTGLRVGISVADAGAAPLWHALETALAGAPEVTDLVRYRVGPSVGAHTGPGTAGAMYYATSIRNGHSGASSRR